jgi:hypothetical protein
MKHRIEFLARRREFITLLGGTVPVAAHPARCVPVNFYASGSIATTMPSRAPRKLPGAKLDGKMGNIAYGEKNSDKTTGQRRPSIRATPRPSQRSTRADWRDDTPYQGEDLIYDAEGPSFLARCTRDRAGPTPGTCLYERRIGAADVVVRFPREWLGDWRMVAGTLDRLIASVRPPR